jgi:DNA replication protein DnaC
MGAEENNAFGNFDYGRALRPAKRVRFARVAELVTQLIETREEQQLTRLRDQLSKLHMLVLDKLGYVPASKVEAELLLDLIVIEGELESLRRRGGR